ncbi:restriction endonuclease subunit S [Paracoccus shanxieyensis]|uniref:Restriction endonuclease subunit S n=1 Tax=Paracoccus shanxieyensis TaxID=2675752 RepID=A0A6L6J528_9RHOB|nr:restriction endonuclease subunit S [Paracoccus shanxieyensis]MTH66350.1 restriction endonuclease subunit S [Paracoccus shanxieyensis]MTH89554.1 restriction endonuclease subunit S [Paracoccus shanxieyensis]
MGWPLVRLGEVAEQVSRGEPPVTGTDYRLLGVRLWGQGAYERETIDGSETKYATLYRVETGDIVVNKIWARNGSVAVVGPDLHGTFGSSEFPTFQTNNARLLPDWFRLFTLTKDLWDQCDSFSRGTSGQNRLRPAKFLEIQIPLPPLAEQQRIVARLDRVAGLVRARAEAAAAMEADLQAMLAKAFARCIDAAPRRPMAEVAPLIRRPVEIEPDGAYPELGVRSFGRGTFHKPVLPGSEVGTKKLFEIAPGDLLFNIVFAWEGAVAIAQPADTGRVGSHRFLTCVPEPATATADFLLFYFQTPEGLQRLGEASPGGAGRNRTLGLKKLETIEVPLPPLETQRWFDRLQAKARQIRDIRAASARDTDALIPALLHQVFGAGDRAA